MIELDTRHDINLETYQRVAWEGEAARFSTAALARIEHARRSFLAYVEAHPTQRIYGANTRVGPGAKSVLTGEELEQQTQRRPGAAGVSFGEPLPPRVVRGVLLSRLANFIDGHSAVSLPVASAVVAMLDGRDLPVVPGRANGAAGEINALGHLFFDMTRDLPLGPKDNSALTNGAPCASALVADAVLCARRRLHLTTEVFALAIEAFKAPLEHYDRVLAACWGNPHDAAALDALAPLLSDTDTGRRNYQAPVSFRILPKLLGQAHQALSQATQTAQWSLPSVSDNPTFLPPGSEHAPVDQFPLGRVLHTGGFHNAAAYTSIDALAGVWADLVQLTERLCAKTLDGDVSGLPHGLQAGAIYDTVRYLPGALLGLAEQARRSAQRTFLPASGEYAARGQSDVAVPTFAAWTADAEAGDCLVGALAVLGVTAAQALDITERSPTRALKPIHDTIRSAVPVIEAPRLLGPELNELSSLLKTRVKAAPTDAGA